MNLEEIISDVMIKYEVAEVYAEACSAYGNGNEVVGNIVSTIKTEIKNWLESKKSNDNTDDNWLLDELIQEVAG